MIEIAVIFTCFNRKDKTERCLNSIYYQQKKHGNIKFQVYVTDDGSTDGTKDMLGGFSGKLSISIFEGNNLFWNKGMHLAMKKATQKKHDFYLMINDDVGFYDDFLDVMIDSFKKVGESCGISGSTQDTGHLYTTYGGKELRGKEFINPNGSLQECNLANWNCFLVDQGVIDKVGIIDPNYDHSYGDYDYSLAMQRNGFKLYLAEEYIGTCDRNDTKGTFKDKKLTRRQRIRSFFSPKGMPIQSLFRYSFKNFDYIGIRGLLYFLGSYLINLLEVLG